MADGGESRGVTDFGACGSSDVEVSVHGSGELSSGGCVAAEGLLGVIFRGGDASSDALESCIENNIRIDTVSGSRRLAGSLDGRLAGGSAAVSLVVDLLLADAVGERGRGVMTSVNGDRN